MNKLFYAFNHQNKARSYIKALTLRGWRQTTRMDQARFVLSDIDIYGREKQLEISHRRGSPVFLYPHAAVPNVFWDFPSYTYSKVVTAHFVPAPGHIDIMRAYGNPYKLTVTGFHLSPIRPFQPRAMARNILFAPIHPNSNTFLCSVHMEINKAAYRKLLPLVESGSINLTVRYLNKLEQNGLWEVEGVHYVEGKRDLSYVEIDNADVVISHDTFGYMAVARGVPTLMMAEHTAPRIGGTEHGMQIVKSWEKYRDMMAYPLDFLSDESAELLFIRAISSDRDIADWRQRMIGEPFDGSAFVDTVEGML